MGPSFVFLALCAWLFAADAQANGQPWGFPLDDAWIHMTFGRNLAHGAGFGVNPGEPSGASTSVLWSLWMGILHLLPTSWGVAAVIAGVKMSGVLLGLAAIAGVRRFLCAAGCSEGETLIGSLMTLGSYPLAWAALSGMEVPLTCALCAWALAFQLEAALPPHGAPIPAIRPDGARMTGVPSTGVRSRAAVFLWTLAVLARPENAVLLVLATCLLWREDRGSGWRGLARLAVIALPVIAAYAAFLVYLCGKPWPTTFEAKMSATAIPALIRSGNWAGFPSALAGVAGTLGGVVSFLLGENCIVLALILLVPVLIYIMRDSSGGAWARAAALAWLSLPLQAVLVALVAAPESYTAFHGRYLAHTLWIAAPGAFLVAAAAWRHVGRPRWIWIAVGIGLLAMADRQIDLARVYPLETANITNLQVRIARWFGESLRGGGPVAINDVGAMGYFSGRRLIDLEGLITPEAVSWNRSGRIDAFIEKKQPEYVLIFPYWYPEVVARLNVFRPILRFAIERNITGGGEEMVLFGMPWTPKRSEPWPPWPSPGLPERVPVP
ncbi:MAG TPA: hypothetical protein PLP29_16720 [Candidatus Ozemobacteraceae bacterium]|nr:hypothetical protein [Candidatus Ozemobacteraceae bacterium]